MNKTAAVMGVVVYGVLVIVGGTGCRRRGLVETSSAPSVPVTAQTLGLAKLSASYAEAKASAKKEGIPLTPADLVRPSVPDSENAAPVYRQLTKLLTAKPIASSQIIGSLTGKRMPDAAQIAEVRAELKAHADVLALAHKAASRPKCNFARDYALGPKLLFPEYAKMRSAIRTLTAESTVMLADGKPFDAIHNQTLGFNIARHAATDHTVISYLVAIAIDSITLHGMEKILHAAGDKLGVATAVEKSIAANWQPHSFKQALGGEAVLLVRLQEGLSKGGPEYDSDIATAYQQAQQKENAAHDWQPFLDANGAYMLDVVRATHNRAGDPYPVSLPALRRIETAVRDDKSNPHLFGSILTPVYAQSLNKNASDEARIDVVRCAARVLAWRQTHNGTFPKSLAEAMTKVPMDPYNGNPLRYRVVGNGFVVYSVGPTGKFDGGAPAKKPDAQEGYFQYPLAPYETALAKFTTPTK